MSTIPFALALVLTLGLPLSSQSFAAQVTASRGLTEALLFEIPLLHVTGMVRAASGNRLQVVTIVLGEEPFGTDVRRFVLVATTGVSEPIGAGGRADLTIPLDRVPIGTFLFEVPRGATVRSLRMPDGRELTTPP
jgi:hypothetical protein